MFDAAAIATQLRTATSTDNGEAIIAKLTAAQLRQVFTAAGYQPHGRTKKDLTGYLIQILVSGRLDAQAILNARW